MKRIYFILLLCLVTFCAPPKVDLEKKANDYIAFFNSASSWAVHPSGPFDNKVFGYDARGFLSHDLLTGQDTIILKCAADKVFSMVESTDSFFVFKERNEYATMGYSAVYKFDYASNKLVNLWEEVYGDNDQFFLYDAFKPYLLFLNVKDSKRTYGPGNGIPIFPDEDLILYNYQTHQSRVVDFLTSDGKVINRKTISSNPSMRKFSSSYIDYHMILDRWYGNDNGYGKIELYHFAPALGETDVKLIASGEQLNVGSDDEGHVFSTIKITPDSYAKFNYKGEVVSQFPTSSGYVKKEHISNDDLVAVFPQHVLYFKTVEGTLADYVALFCYDVSTQTNQEFKSIIIDGRDVPITVNTARPSRDKQKVIINCSSSAEEYLLELSESWWETRVAIITKGRSIITTDTYYSITGRNGEVRFYDLDGKEISETRAGLNALGISDLDLFNLF